jgi:hypothetical protein
VDHDLRVIVAVAHGTLTMEDLFRPRSSKEVGVLRTMAEALAFLGLNAPVRMPDWTAK